MTRLDKILARILRGTADNNILFEDLCQVLRYLNFEERVRGSHHIFTKSDIVEIINLQPRGSKAKTYQVRQVRNIILSYKLLGDE